MVKALFVRFFLDYESMGQDLAWMSSCPKENHIIFLGLFRCWYERASYFFYATLILDTYLDIWDDERKLIIFIKTVAVDISFIQLNFVLKHKQHHLKIHCRRSFRKVFQVNFNSSAIAAEAYFFLWPRWVKREIDYFVIILPLDFLDSLYFIA